MYVRSKLFMISKTRMKTKLYTFYILIYVLIYTFLNASLVISIVHAFDCISFIVHKFARNPLKDISYILRDAQAIAIFTK